VDRLRAAGLPSPEVDARRIVERASGHEGAALALGLGELATVRGVARFDAMLARRAAGEPLQYVLGGWGFRSLDLFVDRRVLIPRPETEQVVEAALAQLRRVGGVGLLPARSPPSTSAPVRAPSPSRSPSSTCTPRCGRPTPRPTPSP
jgi:methylase of polypeptide subunit release factors